MARPFAGRAHKAFYMALELSLRFVVSPFLRARLLRLLGAQVGRDVRIYEVQLWNLDDGFRNLRVEDGAHIGMACRLDLKGPIVIRRGATLAAGVSVLTHADPGSYQRSPLCQVFPPVVAGVEIGEHCWIGANAIVLPGARIGPRTAVGAGSVVDGTLESDSVYVGVPARKLRSLRPAERC